ncbi:hypothetical protein [Winogradskyella sediminis]|uniref:hypothetical protein n=1 Tax=Winogradskyella sediminis TaxID=1382466 RepID=UPI003AA97E6A
MPLGESMRSTLKSNKAIMIDKSRRFRKTLGGYNKGKKKVVNFPNATSEDLQLIKQKLKKENQRLWCKVAGALVLFIGVLLLLIIW